MATITTRSTKGSPLTHAEMDDNFSNINAATLPTGGSNNQVLAKTSATDYATGWVTLTDTNTTYAISAETATSGANLRLTGSDATTDNVNIVGGAGVTITRTDANTITIDAAGTDPIAETLRTLVYNADSVTLTKGTPVYVFGAQGQNISVKRANNTGDATSAQTLGLVQADITAGAEGYVVTFGEIENINTAGYTEGAGFYLGATAGTITFTKPYAPNHLVYLGFVEKANASSGRVFVKVQNGYELDEIHNVNINRNTVIAGNQYLKYNSSNTLWENADLDISHDTTPTLGGNLFLNNNNINNGANSILLGNGANIASISSNGFTTLRLLTNNGGNSGNITLEPGLGGSITLMPAYGAIKLATTDGTYVEVGDTTGTALITSSGFTALRLETNNGANSGSIVLNPGTGSSIDITPPAFGNINLDNGPFGKVVIGNSANQGAITSNGFTALRLETNSGSNSGSIVLNPGTGSNIDITSPAFGNININPNGGSIITGNGANASIITSSGSTNLRLSTNSNNANSGSVTITPGPSGEVLLTSGAFGRVLVGNNVFGNTAIIASSGAQPLTLQTASGNTASVRIQSGTSANILLETGSSGRVTVGNQSFANTAIIASSGAQDLTLQTSSGNTSSIKLQSGPTANILLETGFAGRVTLSNQLFGNTAILSSSGSQSLTLTTNSGNTASVVLQSGPTANVNIETGLAGIVTIGNQILADTAILSSNSAQPLTLQTGAGNTAIVNITSGIDATVAIQHGAFGKVTLTNQYFGNTAILSSSDTQALTLQSDNSSIVIGGSGGSGHIDISPTGNTYINKGIVGYTVFNIGNSGTSTLTPNASNGQIQTITATGNFTLSAFTSPVSGQHIKFIIIQDATGNRTLTSSMRFEGASKTLSTAANARDILDVWYIGTTYYASLTKGYA